MIQVKFALRMIILVLYHAGCGAAEAVGVLYKMFIGIGDGNTFCPFYLFPYAGYTQAAFCICIGLGAILQDLRIQEYLAYAACFHGIAAIHHKQLQGLIHLLGRQAYAAGIIEGLPHIGN